MNGSTSSTVATGAPLLELEDVTVVRNGARVLDGLNVLIRSGEHTAILGPNGSGKTTFINLLAQEAHAFYDPLIPSAVRVLGSERWIVSDLRRKLGIVSPDLQRSFVNGNSLGSINGVNAVLSGFFATHGVLEYAPVSDEMRGRAASALAAVGATHLAHTPMEHMSTGEARRILIARALVSAPPILVLDEPTAGLDLAARHAFLETVREVTYGGVTVVLVTHDVEEIVPEIARVLLMAQGRVVADGPKAEMLTSARLGALFGTAIHVQCTDGHYHARAVRGAAPGASHGIRPKKMTDNGPE